MNIRNKLVEEFNSELESLGKMELGTDTYKATVDGVTKLADRIIEIDKLDAEMEDKKDSRLSDTDLKIQQFDDEKRDRKIRNGITIGTFVGSALLYVGAFIASTNFEKHGTFTTEGGKSSIRQLLKLKF